MPRAVARGVLHTILGQPPPLFEGKVVSATFLLSRF